MDFFKFAIQADVHRSNWNSLLWNSLPTHLESRHTSLTFVIQADVSRSVIVTNSYSSNNVYPMASPTRQVFFIDVGKTCKMFHMDEPRILITKEKEFIYERK